MIVSPFTFYRGRATIMVSDVSRSSTTGLRVQCCGGAQLSNFVVVSGSWLSARDHLSARGPSSSSRASIALSRTVTSRMTSGSCSGAGGWRRRAASIRAAVTAAVITVRKAMPLIITTAPITRLVPLLGTMSPYPTRGDRLKRPPQTLAQAVEILSVGQPRDEADRERDEHGVTGDDHRRAAGGERLPPQLATRRPAAGAPAPGSP
jgi:hypothetical protein